MSFESCEEFLFYFCRGHIVYLLCVGLGDTRKGEMFYFPSWLVGVVAVSGRFLVSAPFDVDVLLFTLSGVVSSPGGDCGMVVTVMVLVL